MTEYWIDVHECDRILSDLSDQIFDLLGDYTAAQEALKDTRVHLCASYERQNMEGDAQLMDEAIVDFADVRLKDHVDGVISHVQKGFSSMQDVLYYYTSGDAQMAADANSGGPGEIDVPELRYHGEPPEQSVIPDEYHQTRVGGTATESPYQTSYDHHPAG